MAFFQKILSAKRRNADFIEETAFSFQRHFTQKKYCVWGVCGEVGG